MNFGNNIEAMASEKSGWAIIDQSADGSVIYMGKPVNDNVKLSDNAWLIKKITTETDGDGSQIIKTQYAEPRYKCAWNDRKDLEYMPKFEEVGTFYLEHDGTITAYNFILGMTWEEFIDSEYNPEVYYGDSWIKTFDCLLNVRYYDTGCSVMDGDEMIYRDDLIKNQYKYRWL